MSIASRECHMRASSDIDSVTQRNRVVRRDESTTVLLIRHARTIAIDRWLCGRLLGITLSGVGVLEAEELGRTLGKSCRLAAIYSSPLARDTALAIARYQHAHVHICDALNEIDFGAWTGKTFRELDADPRWHAFNRIRAGATIPGGELPHAAQQRIVTGIERLAEQHRGQTIALVSHADIVRFALLHYRPASLNRERELTIEPASVSAVNVSPDGVHVVFVNRRASALRP